MTIKATLKVKKYKELIFSHSGKIVLIKYLKSLHKLLIIEKGVFSPLDGSAAQCAPALKQLESCMAVKIREKLENYKDIILFC